MADVPAARLAEIVPARWAETRRRIVAVRRLLREEDQSGPTIMRYADELGVSRQMIYKLIGIVRKWDAANGAPPDPTRWRSKDGDTAAAVRDALTELGRGALAEQVLARAGEIAAARGVAKPTRPQVYVAMGRTGAGTALARRLRLASGGLLLDAAPLSVGVARDDPRRPAVLTGACDLDLGGLAAWTITDGPPDAEALRLLLCSAGASPISPPMATAALRATAGAPELAAPPGRVRAGSAIKAAVGGVVGRIKLLPQPALARDATISVVSPGDLRRVMQEVLNSPDALVAFDA